MLCNCTFTRKGIHPRACCKAAEGKAKHCLNTLGGGGGGRNSPRAAVQEMFFFALGTSLSANIQIWPCRVGRNIVLPIKICYHMKGQIKKYAAPLSVKLTMSGLKGRTY